MDKVFPKNMDPVDKDDLKNGVQTLDEYVRYMREQIEWAVNVILTLNNGTSLADVAMKINKLQNSISSLQNELTTLDNRTDAITQNLNNVSNSVLLLDNNTLKKSDVVTTIDSSSTDDEIPTAKAVYDFVGGNGT